MTIHRPAAPTADDRPDGAAGGGIQAPTCRSLVFTWPKRPVTQTRYARPLRRRRQARAWPGGGTRSWSRGRCWRVDQGTCLEQMSARAGPFHSVSARCCLHSNSMGPDGPGSQPPSPQEPEHLSLWPLPVSRGSGAPRSASLAPRGARPQSRASPAQLAASGLAAHSVQWMHFNPRQDGARPDRGALMRSRELRPEDTLPREQARCQRAGSADAPHSRLLEEPDP